VIVSVARHSTYDIRPAEGHGILMNKDIAAALAADAAMPFMSRYRTWITASVHP
jgi:hypothetical protein